MIAKELFSKYGISAVYDMDGIVDALFSATELDPMFWAESDGYNLAEGKPFITMAAIGPERKVLSTIVVFKDYKSRLVFEENCLILMP